LGFSISIDEEYFELCVRLLKPKSCLGIDDSKILVYPKKEKARYTVNAEVLKILKTY
jgi:hypothetical protein